MPLRHAGRPSAFGESVPGRVSPVRPASELLHRAIALLDDALAQPPAERAAWLESACAGDAALHLEAAELLRRCAEPLEAVSFLDEGATEWFDELAMAPGPSTPDLTGVLLAERWAIERRLGQGGMASVWLARDARYDREAAVKVLHPALASGIDASRFRAEIEIVARLRHPYLVPLWESGVANGVVFYAMPRITGGSLRDRLAPRPARLPISEVLHIAGDVAEALDHVHLHNILHRDVKPENILLEGDHAYLSDFGIARVLESVAGERLTSARIVLGTPEYMSPEQAEGSDRLGPASDVYALGCVVYEMLAGEPPFTGADARAVLARHCVAPVPRVSVVRDTAELLDPVLSRALAKEPADRWASAGEFAAALAHAWQQGAPVRAPAPPPAPTPTPAPAPSPEPAPLPVRRARWRRWLALAASAAVSIPLVADVSPPTYGAYANGVRAVGEWDLARADAAFGAAFARDTGDALALLHQAEVRALRGDAAGRWKSLARRAAASGRLVRDDTLLAAALVALGDGDHAAACPRWERLVARRPNDFASWYGLGVCLMDDHVVVRDAGSPSGWRMRSSYHRALRAQERARSLRPALHRGLAALSPADLRELFVTSSNVVRQGFGEADRTPFTAYPSWEGNALVFVPFLARDVSSGRADLSRVRTDDATRNQRLFFFDVATAWLAAEPASGAALEAYAAALEMLHRPAALDTLRVAAARATDARTHVRVAGLEIWLRFKRAAPDDTTVLADVRTRAGALLDSVSTRDAHGEEAMLASLAALVGRGALALRHARTAAGGASASSLEGDGSALVSRSAFGRPDTLLYGLEARVSRAIDVELDQRQRSSARLEWLARAATLAFPAVRLKALDSLRGRGDAVLDAQAALLAGDRVAMRAQLRQLRRERVGLQPQDLTTDGLLPEAAMLALAGDTAAAIATLDPTLDRLAVAPPGAFADVVRAATLVRAMALRAELAAGAGDRAGARRWASAVATLWRDADPALRPVVMRMQDLARIPAPP